MQAYVSLLSTLGITVWLSGCGDSRAVKIIEVKCKTLAEEFVDCETGALAAADAAEIKILVLANKSVAFPKETTKKLAEELAGFLPRAHAERWAKQSVEVLKRQRVRSGLTVAVVTTTAGFIVNLISNPDMKPTPISSAQEEEEGFTKTFISSSSAITVSAVDIQPVIRSASNGTLVEQLASAPPLTDPSAAQQDFDSAME